MSRATGPTVARAKTWNRGGRAGGRGDDAEELALGDRRIDEREYVFQVTSGVSRKIIDMPSDSFFAASMAVDPRAESPARASHVEVVACG